MKRLLLLLAVLALIVGLAWLTYDWWHPVLESLSDELQGLEAIVSMVVILGGGIAAFLGLRGKAPAADAVSRAGRDFPPELPRDPAYEPTPVPDTAPALDADASPYLGRAPSKKPTPTTSSAAAARRGRPSPGSARRYPMGAATAIIAGCRSRATAGPASPPWSTPACCHSSNRARWRHGRGSPGGESLVP